MITGEEILDRLNAGEYDDVCHLNDGFNGGSPWGIRIVDGQPEKFKNHSLKFFDGKENERSSYQKVEWRPKTDEDKLNFLKYYCYNDAFEKHPEIREYFAPLKQAELAKSKAAAESVEILAKSKRAEPRSLVDHGETIDSLFAEPDENDALSIADIFKGELDGFKCFASDHRKEIGVGLLIAFATTTGFVLIKKKAIPYFKERKAARNNLETIEDMPSSSNS